jgi:hypothetical protein
MATLDSPDNIPSPEPPLMMFEVPHWLLARNVALSINILFEKFIIIAWHLLAEQLNALKTDLFLKEFL